MKLARLGLTLALAVVLGGAAKAQVAILQIQVIEGEGVVHAPGSHAARVLTVEITDETGKPVEGAAVSFHLPEEGPSGAFANGLRTDVATSDSRGRATLHNLTLNRVGGRFQLRVVASREQARAGIVSFQYIAESASGAAAASAAVGPHHRTRWIAIAALAGAGTVAAVLAGHSGGGVSPASAPASAGTAPVVSVGTPTITIGKP